MSSFNLVRWLKSLPRLRVNRVKPILKKPRVRLFLEELETRITPTTISPNPAWVSENAGQLTFMVTRSDNSSAATMYATTLQDQGTINSGVYYVGLVNHALNFSAGQSTASVPVTINDLHLTSGSETFRIIVQHLATDPNNVYLATDNFTILNNDSAVVTPSLPVHVSPSNNGTVNGPSVTFNWNQSSNATRYELYVRDLTTQALSTYTISGGATTQTTLTLVQGRSYRWNMQAFNGSMGSGVTTAWQFAVNAPVMSPSLPVHVSPSNNGTVDGPSVTFNWNQSSNATSYELYVRDLTTQALSTYPISGGATTRTTLTLAQGQSYRWNMQAFTGGSGSGVTTAWDFAVNAPVVTEPPRQGVDYSAVRPSPSTLKLAGYDFVVRYVSAPGNAKNISSSEAQALRNAGIDIILVFESTADRMLDGYNAGVADANTAITVGTAAGAPQGFFCYFAFDPNARPGDQTGTNADAINAYLDGAAAVLGSASRVGFYGSYEPLKRVLDAGKATKGWQTSSESYGKIDSRISLFQDHNTAAKIGGCDLDNGFGRDLGQWSVSPLASPTLTVTSPNGGETWGLGVAQTITWSISGNTSQIDHFLVSYSLDGGTTYLDDVGIATATSRSISWCHRS